MDGDQLEESEAEEFVVVNKISDSEEEAVETQTMANNLPHVFNLSNSIIGITILAMPFCFKECGIILGAFLLMFCTWLTLVSCRLLMKAGITSRRRSYGFLAYYTYGAPGKLAVEIGMIGLQIGTLIAQVVIIGDLGPNIISKYTGLPNTHNLRTGVITVLCLVVGLPLCLLKNLHSLSRASTMCVLFYTIFVFYVIFMSVPKLIDGSWIHKVKLWRVDGMLKCLPIFSFAFGCQTQLFILYDVLAEPSLKGINSIVSSAVNLCTVAYMLVGFFGYVTFCDQDIGGDVITEYKASLLSDILQLGFVTTIAVTFPLIIYPCRVSLYTLLFSQKQKHAEDLEQRPVIPEIHFKVLTATVVVFAMVTGILVPNVEFVLQMNGATMGTLICYIFPAVFFLRVMTGSSDNKNRAQAVFVFGFLIMVLCTYTALSIHDQNLKPVEVLQDKEQNIPKPADVDNGREKPLQPPVNVQNPAKDAGSIKDKPPDSVPLVKKGDGKEDADKRVEPPYPREPVEGDKKAKDMADADRRPASAAVVDTQLQRAADTQVHQDSKPVDREVRDVNKNLDQKTVDSEKEKLTENAKQKELIAQLEKQQKEQKQLIEEQKVILKELKEHKLEHKQNDINQEKAQEPGQQNQPVVGGQQPLGDHQAGDQQIGGQQVGGQQVGGQQVGGQQIGGQQVSGQQVGGQQVGGQQVGGQQVGGQQVGGQQVGGQQVGGQQVGAQQAGGQPVGGQQVNGQQVGGQPVRSQQNGQQIIQQNVGQKADGQLGGQLVGNQLNGGQQVHDLRNLGQQRVTQQVGNQGVQAQQPIHQQAPVNQQIGGEEATKKLIGGEQVLQQVNKNGQIPSDLKLNKENNIEHKSDGIVNDMKDGQGNIVKKEQAVDSAPVKTGPRKDLNLQINNKKPIESQVNSVVGQNGDKKENLAKHEIRRRREVNGKNKKEDKQNVKHKYNEEMKRKKLLSVDSKNIDINEVLENIDKNSLLAGHLSQIRSLKSVNKDSSLVTVEKQA